MKVNRYQITFTLLFFSNLIYSQKLEKPEEVSDKDFTIINYQTPTILSHNILMTFPYHENNGTAGALDKYFSLRIESLIRLLINKGDTCKKLLVLPKTFEKGVRITSIKYFYKNKNSISTRKIKEDDIIITSDDLGFYIDYSNIIKDSSAVLDISFSSDSKSKEKLLYYLDKNKNYKNFSAQIYIPEIYSYDIFPTDSCFEINLKKDVLGPKIGYKPISGSYKELSPQVLVDMFGKEFNAKYDAVYCNLTLISLRTSNSCTGFVSNSYKDIINYKLKKIVEIK
jgi:hypothetical protein